MSEYIFVTNIFEYSNIRIYSSHSGSILSTKPNPSNVKLTRVQIFQRNLILQMSNWLEFKSFTETDLSLARYPGVPPLHVDAHTHSNLMVFWINLLHVVYSEEKVHNLRPDDRCYICLEICPTFELGQKWFWHSCLWDKSPRCTHQLSREQHVQLIKSGGISWWTFWKPFFSSLEKPKARVVGFYYQIPVNWEAHFGQRIRII